MPRELLTWWEIPSLHITLPAVIQPYPSDIQRLIVPNGQGIGQILASLQGLPNMPHGNDLTLRIHDLHPAVAEIGDVQVASHIKH